MQIHLSVDSLSLVIGVLSLVQGAGGGNGRLAFSRGNLCLAFRHMGEGREFFLHVLFLKYL